MSRTSHNDDPRVAIVGNPLDSDVSEQPFGKRWGHEVITLKPSEIDALREGKLLALDVRAEYVVYLKLDAAIEATLKESGNG